MNFYEELGVPKDATPDEIKRAYRKKARKHHPDRGGDREQFESATKAYDTLYDVGRRLLYDRTGQVPPPNANINSLQRLLALLLQVVDSPNIDPEHTDIIAMMRKSIEDGRAGMYKQIHDYNVKMERRRVVIRRLQVKSGNPNLMIEALHNDIKVCQQKIEGIMVHGIQIATLDLAVLAEYEYLFDPLLPGPQQVWFASGSVWVQS